MIDLASFDLGALTGSAVIAGLIFIFQLKGTTPMPPISQDVQDFCSTLETRVKAANDAAYARGVADGKASAASDVQAVQAEAVQDHQDELAALNAALDQAAPAAS